MPAPQPQPLIDTLASFLPSPFLLTAPADCAAFAVHGATPACVAAPGSQEQLSEVMRVACQQRVPVVPWGGGTQQLIGSPLGAGGQGPRVRGQGSEDQASHPDPRRPIPDPFVVVRTERLDRVLIHEPDDLTISVEAGMTLGALRQHLARFNQMLPIDPPLPDRATIGGLIAAATDGPRRLGYGTLRDLLIGITVVEASGRVSRAGGMVVKNVSGFDMMKLYLGSFGTLAVIASANFKLLPRPRATVGLVCDFDGPDRAFALLGALGERQLTPTAAEYLGGGALAALGLAGRCAVALRAEGLAAAVERHAAELSALAAAHGAALVARYDGPDDEALWARIADLPQTASLAPDEAVIKCAGLPSETAAVVARIEAAWGASAAVSARALDGVVYARLRPASAAELARLAADLPALQWVATPVADAPRWGQPPQGLDLMRRIQSEFDPLGLLNPGRFVVHL